MTLRAPKDPIPTLNLFHDDAEWPIKGLLYHELLQARFNTHEGKIKTHRHLDLFHVALLSRGTVQTLIDGEERSISGPTVMTIPAMCVHGFAPTSNIAGHLLTLPGSSIQHLLTHAESDCDLLESSCIITANRGESFQEIEGLFQHVARESKSNEHSQFMAQQAFMRLIFVWIIRRQVKNNAETRPSNDRDAIRIRRFKKLIEANFTRSLTIKEYASELGLSAAQLNNICRAKVGKTALQIVHERMILEVKRNLVYTSSPISEIAYNLGFSDPAYFTRFFSKLTGVSPKQYRCGARP